VPLSCKQPDLDSTIMMPKCCSQHLASARYLSAYSYSDSSTTTHYFTKVSSIQCSSLMIKVS
jgi:hypothetical protein